MLFWFLIFRTKIVGIGKSPSTKGEKNLFLAAFKPTKSQLLLRKHMSRRLCGTHSMQAVYSLIAATQHASKDSFIPSFNPKGVVGLFSASSLTYGCLTKTPVLRANNHIDDRGKRPLAFSHTSLFNFCCYALAIFLLSCVCVRARV